MKRYYLECKKCKQHFVALRATAKYCSNYCRISAYRKRKGIPEPIFDFSQVDQDKKKWKLF